MTEPGALTKLRRMAAASQVLTPMIGLGVLRRTVTPAVIPEDDDQALPPAPRGEQVGPAAREQPDRPGELGDPAAGEEEPEQRIQRILVEVHLGDEEADRRCARRGQRGREREPIVNRNLAMSSGANKPARPSRTVTLRTCSRRARAASVRSVPSGLGPFRCRGSSAAPWRRRRCPLAPGGPSRTGVVPAPGAQALTSWSRCAFESMRVRRGSVSSMSDAAAARRPRG